MENKIRNDESSVYRTEDYMKSSALILCPITCLIVVKTALMCLVDLLKNILQYKLSTLT